MNAQAQSLVMDEAMGHGIAGLTILLGGELRLFDDFGMEAIQLERLTVQQLPHGRTHLRFRIVS